METVLKDINFSCRMVKEAGRRWQLMFATWGSEMMREFHAHFGLCEVRQRWVFTESNWDFQLQQKFIECSINSLKMSVMRDFHT